MAAAQTPATPAHAAAASDVVVTSQDIEFAQVGGVTLTLDVYSPTAGAPAGPAIVLVHGGAWGNGKAEDLDAEGALVAREGWVAFSINYRLADQTSNPWPDELHRRAARRALGGRPRRDLRRRPDQDRHARASRPEVTWPSWWARSARRSTARAGRSRTTRSAGGGEGGGGLVAARPSWPAWPPRPDGDHATRLRHQQRVHQLLVACRYVTHFLGCNPSDCPDRQRAGLAHHPGHRRRRSRSGGPTPPASWSPLIQAEALDQALHRGRRRPPARRDRPAAATPTRTRPRSGTT